MGRRVRSFRKRLSRDEWEPGIDGVEGVVGDCGGTLGGSECNGSSSNSTFGTWGVVRVRYIDRTGIHTHMLVG